MAFKEVDWERKGQITMTQLCHLLVIWHTFDKSRNIRKSVLALRRVLAQAFRVAFLCDQASDSFTWEQVYFRSHMP